MFDLSQPVLIRFRRNGFVAFVESSKAYSLRKYNNSNRLSWYNFVNDYFNSRIAASKDPIDLRPVLNMLVRRGGSQGLRLDTLGEVPKKCLWGWYRSRNSRRHPPPVPHLRQSHP
jgi:hypothetical protein